VTQVSVVLPTFNRAAWLPHAIDSVLHQRFRDFELIVVDDGSSDDTPEVLKRYGDALKWVTQPNAGVSCARNRGISMARGDWLAFIDSDDEWHADFLCTLMQIVQDQPDVQLVTADGHFVGHRGLHSTYFCLNGTTQALGNLHSAPSGHKDCFRLERGFQFIVQHPPWQVGATLMCHETVLRCGSFNPELKVSEDLDLMARMALCGPMALVNRPLIDVHRRPADPWSLSDPQHLPTVKILRANEKVYARLTNVPNLTAQERRTMARVCAQNRRALAHELALQQHIFRARAWYLRSVWISPSWAGLAALATSCLPAPWHRSVLRWVRQWKQRTPVEGTS